MLGLAQSVRSRSESGMPATTERGKTARHAVTPALRVRPLQARYEPLATTEVSFGLLRSSPFCQAWRSTSAWPAKKSSGEAAYEALPLTMSRSSEVPKKLRV